MAYLIFATKFAEFSHTSFLDIKYCQVPPNSLVVFPTSPRPNKLRKLKERKLSQLWSLTSTCERPPTWPPVRGCKQAMCCDIVGEWWGWLISGRWDCGPHWWLCEYCWFWCIGWWWDWWTGWYWGWCNSGCIRCLQGVCCWVCGCQIYEKTIIIPFIETMIVYHGKPAIWQGFS